jgi:hypothetical protein
MYVLPNSVAHWKKRSPERCNKNCCVFLLHAILHCVHLIQLCSLTSVRLSVHWRIWLLQMAAECQLSSAVFQPPAALNYEHLPVGCMQVGKIKTKPNIPSILGSRIGAGIFHWWRSIKTIVTLVMWPLPFTTLSLVFSSGPPVLYMSYFPTLTYFNNS